MEPSQVFQALENLYREVLQSSQTRFPVAGEREGFVASSANLAAYLELRSHDLRPLQDELALLGLSSLGRSEARVIPSLAATLRTLGLALGKNSEDLPPYPSRETFFAGRKEIAHQASELFGTEPKGRYTRIMVTLPTQAATNPELLLNLLAKGTDLVRINTAHDNSEIWQAMLANLTKAQDQTGRSVRVLFDLAGPKLRVEAVGPDPQGFRVHSGDSFKLCAGDLIGSNAIRASVALLDRLEVGTRVSLDDGKIAAYVESVSDDCARIKVEQTPIKGARVTTGKGINFPGLELDLPPLSPADLAVLPFVAQNADLIGFSFVQRPEDLKLLDMALAKSRKIPLILKIETRLAVRNLPELLVASGSQRPTGVMIARGDLAVELSYQRLAEMQEELLWLCEAAHTPVVWATQVLERLVKKGTPARGEVTDAAAASQSECVMLNKGPFLVEAVELLDDVLRRMQSHRVKKTPLLRPLKAWS